VNDQSVTKVNSIRPGCLANMFWSFIKVAQNQGAAGVDRVTMDDFSKGLSSRLKRLTKMLATEEKPEETSSHDSREDEVGERSQPEIHHRWPNTFFANAGLFSLVTAHRLTSQSSQKKNHQPESRVREIRTHSSEGRETGLPYPDLGFVSDFCRDCKSSGDYEMVTLI